MKARHIIATIALFSTVMVSAQTGPKAKNQKAWNSFKSTKVVYSAPEHIKGPQVKNQKLGEQNSPTFAVNTNNKNTLQGPKRKNESVRINNMSTISAQNTQTFALNTECKKEKTGPKRKNSRP